MADGLLLLHPTIVDSIGPTKIASKSWKSITSRLRYQYSIDSIRGLKEGLKLFLREADVLSIISVL